MRISRTEGIFSHRRLQPRWHTVWDLTSLHLAEAEEQSRVSESSQAVGTCGAIFTALLQ